jgi:hypothetical protein
MEIFSSFLFFYLSLIPLLRRVREEGGRESELFSQVGWKRVRERERKREKREREKSESGSYSFGNAIEISSPSHWCRHLHLIV